MQNRLKRTDAAILQHVHHGFLVLEGGAFSPQAQARHEAQVLGLGGTSGTDIQDPCFWKPPLDLHNSLKHSAKSSSAVLGMTFT